MRTGDGTVAVSEIDRLAASLDGRVIRRGDESFEEARHVFNAMIDRRPELIARVSGSDDVRRCLAFAAEHGLPVTVRGGGHNVGGAAVSDGGLVIDFTERRSVRVDEAARSATAEAGATWYDFDQATCGVGLATTGGLVSSTGIAGFTLGGGIGWLVRKHGLACDNLIRAEVVTADGRVLVASPENDADLLWALRGGGGNFGVVTSFTYSLHPMESVLGGLVAHPRERARDMLLFYRGFVADAPEELTTVAALMTTPDGDPACGIAACFAGDPDEGERVLKPLREFGPPVEDHLSPMPYPLLQTMLDPTAPPGMRHYWKADFIGVLTDDAIDALVDAANAMASSLSQIHIHHLGGALARVAPEATAFANRNRAFVFNLVGTWADPTDDDANIAWTRAAFDSLGTARAGSAYINFLGSEGNERVAAAYGGNLQRLIELKRRYDPQNVFRQNQNIVP
jgi:FAD/FMN-containing dehydrogenase